MRRRRTAGAAAALVSAHSQLCIFSVAGWAPRWRSNPVVFVAPDGLEYVRTDDLATAHILYYHDDRSFPALGLRQVDPFAVSSLGELDWIPLLHILDKGWL